MHSTALLCVCIYIRSFSKKSVDCFFKFQFFPESVLFRAGTRTEPIETRRDIRASRLRRNIIASRPRRDFKVTRLHKPKIRKYKNDSNTLEYGLY